LRPHLQHSLANSTFVHKKWTNKKVLGVGFLAHGNKNKVPANKISTNEIEKAKEARTIAYTESI